MAGAYIRGVGLSCALGEDAESGVSAMQRRQVRPVVLRLDEFDEPLQTALRFGAGVGSLAAPANAIPDLSTGLVRDATAVLRNAPLQSQAGGPGTEAFVHSPFVHQALRLYQAGAIPAPASSGLDLMA